MLCLLTSLLFDIPEPNVFSGLIVTADTATDLYSMFVTMEKLPLLA